MLKNITLKSKKDFTNIPKLSSKKSENQTFSKSIDSKNPRNNIRNNILKYNITAIHETIKNISF